MDLKIFPKIHILLKVDHFERFSNWSNVDELVINIIQMGVAVTIINLTITQYSLIPNAF